MSHTQNIVAYVKTKMLLVLGKKHLRNEQVLTENECLPNFELKFKLLENLRKPLTLKSMRKSFHCLPTGMAHKNRKSLVSLSDLVALAMRFKINPQPDDINSFRNVTRNLVIRL